MQSGTKTLDRHTSQRNQNSSKAFFGKRIVTVINIVMIKGSIL